MYDLLQGSRLIAAFLGGAVALFAPCCISVMLPAYFASTFRRRRYLVAMTFVFAAGVATVILPIGLGASWVSSLIQGHHTPVFLTGGILMILLGLATAAGWRPPLPSLGMRARPGGGALSVYTLGAFSGAASACCAPVLAGVVALSGTVASFAVALTIGLAYVLGMVVPLFAIALLWDRRDWGNSRLLRSRSVSIRLGGLRATVGIASIVSGALLVGMGVLVTVIAFTGPAMDQSGWQAQLGARLDHYASRATAWLGHAPGWIYLVVLVLGVTGLARVAMRQVAAPPPPLGPAADLRPRPDLPPVNEAATLEGDLT